MEKGDDTSIANDTWTIKFRKNVSFHKILLSSNGGIALLLGGGSLRFTNTGSPSSSGGTFLTKNSRSSFLTSLFSRKNSTKSSSHLLVKRIHCCTLVRSHQISDRALVA